MTNDLDRVDAYKLAVVNNGRQSSGMLSERRSMKDSARVGEDLKFLLSKLSATRGIELSLNDMIPKVNLMAALYKELEEERNASAVAANQMMAMITRLKEEKATPVWKP
ncbi:hypothetical protein F0562_029535 [Nyssa sinensis]|uniref:GTD-binding domain-containing protein n=1 Tax=Nyssa sinensis TaxID=561372 RepID=A0A5J5B5H4_9ASTE|nr:hypothetical protein F0562_029535 [Nyssa sinensis]